jgi:hypothetical protein
MIRVSRLGTHRSAEVALVSGVAGEEEELGGVRSTHSVTCLRLGTENTKRAGCATPAAHHPSECGSSLPFQPMVEIRKPKAHSRGRGSAYCMRPARPLPELAGRLMR